ncbi:MULTISPECIES: murein hydrolase activator EnvC family protein [Colwellia]|uniref:Non-catalytic member of peptidase subfamily M23B n=1 Tax=Colwellia marinimaniae TaxID=1513592 RepID=A0ABQ0MQX1_9GAMM|nr:MULTISPECIES: peptidoglycan DD-metalloendopeptidase family protein [Colwellia]GAW94582.1 non-catalytic member of peptidase subfamily M23B [Colwellia marinimaniae]
MAISDILVFNFLSLSIASLFIDTYLSSKHFQQLGAASLFIVSLLFAFPAHAEQNKRNESTQQQNRAKLSDVQQAIATQESNIFDTNKQRSNLERQLKTDDLAIAKVAKAINDIEVKLSNTQVKIATLAREKQQLTIAKKKQERLLAQQLRAAYTTGQHDYLKLLLNQNQSDKIQRTISYYQYLNQARTKEIDKFQATITKLLQVNTEHQEQVTYLQQLKAEQLQQGTQLRTSKKQRSKTLSKLSRKLLSSQQQLNKLKAEENNLNQALHKLAAIIQAEIDLTGLSKLKRKLSWPVKGRMLHRFGSRKQGYLKWKGVLISAPISRQVQTIHNGTVLFSDWLKGYGLLTVIDHGNGYMSLYAHNQTLLKAVGDRVETGEPIALVGQSGGQDQSGLYFEIRHRGKALNPKLWCK